MVQYLSCLLLDPPGFSWCLSLLIDMLHPTKENFVEDN